MSDTNRAYYVAAGKSLEQCEAVAAQRRECNVRRKEFRDKHGATGFVQWHGEIAGLIFDGEPPAGWVGVKCEGDTKAFAPSRRTKAMKEIAREMSTLRWDGDIGNEYIGGAAPGGGVYFHFPTMGKFGDKWIISQHEKADPPADAIPLKRSEYWAMVEAQKEEAALSV